MINANDHKNSYSVTCEKEKNSNVLYGILFEYFPEQKNMTIKINEINDGDTKKKINPIYSVRLSLEEWNRLAPDKSEFKDMSVIFQKLSKINNKNCSLKFHDNSLDLVLKLVEYNYDPMEITLKQEIERKDSNPNKIIEENLCLNKENKILEEKIKNLEKEVELLKSALPNYLDKSLFQKLKSSKIIKDLEQLELINRGINNLFRKNIKDIILKFEFKEKEMNNSLSFFDNEYKNLTNILLVFKTKELRSFGAFFQKKDLYKEQVLYEATTTFGAGGASVDGQFNMYGQGNFYNINFNPIQYPNSFFFSLDKLKIYNSNNSQYNIFENPSFIIQYNNYKKQFCGSEQKNQNEIIKNQNAIIQNLQNEINNIKKNMQTINKNQITLNGNYNNGICHVEYTTTSAGSYGYNNKNNAQYMTTIPQQNMNNAYGIDNSMQNITRIDHSFVLSNQEKFESNCLEIYEIIL